VSTYSWDDLQALSTARQFPADLADLGVGAAVDRVGPMQTQTARSAFIGLGARRPGLTLDRITDAYERGEIVRGSTIRGTVHTSTPSQHRLLQAATAVGLRALQRRTLGLDDDLLDRLWPMLEADAADEWRPATELVEALQRAVAGLDPAGEPRSWDQVGRSLAHGHGGLVRRPSRGGWDRQVTPLYRSADVVVDRGPVPDDPLAELVRGHLRSHGPASRYDLAWWAGVGVTVVDPVLARLGDELTARPGPDGRTYHDLASGTPDGTAFRGVRLLPEFDAVLCAYDPKARRRFVDDEIDQVLWNQANGLVLPPLLVDGRIGGFWRSTGSARRRPLAVTLLGRTRRPRQAELTDAVAALAASLDLVVTDVTLERA